MTGAGPGVRPSAGWLVAPQDARRGGGGGGGLGGGACFVLAPASALSSLPVQGAPFLTVSPRWPVPPPPPPPPPPQDASFEPADVEGRALGCGVPLGYVDRSARARHELEGLRNQLSAVLLIVTERGRSFGMYRVSTVDP